MLLCSHISLEAGREKSQLAGFADRRLTSLGRKERKQKSRTATEESRNKEKAGWSEQKSTEMLGRGREIKKGDELLVEAGKINRGGWKTAIEEIGVGGNSHGM